MTATATSRTADLQMIIAGLSEKISEIDGSLTAKSTRLAELQNEHASILQNKQNYSGDLATAQERVAQLTQELARAQTDLTLAAGTSLEGTKKSELSQAKANLGKWQNELSLLQKSLEHDTTAEVNTQSEIATISQQLTALQADRSGLAQTRQRFSTEQANHVRQLGLEMLNEIDSEIAALTGKLDQANAYRAEALRKFALDLAPWERIALDTLASCITVEDTAAVIAAKVQLAQAKEAHAQAVRTKAQSVASLDPTVMGYETQVRVLTARIETLRLEARQDAAMRLLREIAPVPVAQQEFVVEIAMLDTPVSTPAPIPEKETHTLISGIHSLGVGVVGASPKPQSHLRVREQTSS